MLNISKNNIDNQIQLSSFKSYYMLNKEKSHKKRMIFGLVITVILLIVIFVPWTQNIKAKGYVTTLLPNQKPQAVQSVISGRLEKWYVREGQFVKAGDTLVYLSEVKNDYFDPRLIERTQEQVTAKNSSIDAYNDKVFALEQQLQAIKNSQQLKQQQVLNKIIQSKNKILIDSIDLKAYELNLNISKNQFNRTQELYKEGLKSLSDLQEKEMKNQQVNAKYQAQINKLINQKNSLDNLYLEQSNVTQEYAQKIAKTQSDIQSARSGMLEATSNTSKLRNQLSNYQSRQKLYYLTAPMTGHITKTLKKGIGQVVKEGADILTIMPSEYNLAVEVYVKPQDLPLLQIKDHTRLKFDGWPAMVISGWPEASTGIFNGKVFAIDQYISDNGKYRVLICPDKGEKKWPDHLRVGTGTNTFILLNDVPIWYELWRNLNGFPPDFYDNKEDYENGLKRKASK